LVQQQKTQRQWVQSVLSGQLVQQQKTQRQSALSHQSGQLDRQLSMVHQLHRLGLLPPYFRLCP
jgi:hypothetical protein